MFVSFIRRKLQDLNAKQGNAITVNKNGICEIENTQVLVFYIRARKGLGLVLVLDVCK